MRPVAIVLLSLLTGCEFADVEQASTQATCPDDGVCEQPAPAPGANDMPPTRAAAAAHPPIDLAAPTQVETATFGMG